MGKLFTPNITGLGRLARAAWGLALVVAGIALFSRSHWACFLLGAAGIFSLFEAVRGWCIMRACGVKTRL